MYRYQSDDLKEPNLLVFGYSCKLFRDDDKAKAIDEGKHLIPWMSSANQIDRFDVRGLITSDLSMYERNQTVQDSEITEIDRLCESERFYDLRTQEEEDIHEEEIKRLREALTSEGAYNATDFQYEDSNIAENPATEEDVYIQPTGLIVPSGIKLPPTMKSHLLITKTAKFISKHDSQMEILIKTKQSNNENFDFLAFDSPLNAYYKNLVKQIKCGHYAPLIEETKSISETESDSDDDNYLHPSLLGSSKKTTSLVLPNFPGVPADSSYSQLVSQLKGKILTENIPQDVIPQANFVHVSDNINDGRIRKKFQHGLSLLPSPSPEVELIIDKLAMRVAKNGEEFEITVRSRGEERFEFLNPGNVYHAHYIRKKLQYLEEKRKLQAEDLMLKSKAESKTMPEFQSDMLKPPVKFSFNIKDKVSTASFSGGDKLLADLDENSTNKTPNIENKIWKTESVLADRLAVAVRKERLHKEKELQEQRKKKAALFLKMIQSKQGDKEKANSLTYGPSNNSKITLSPTTKAVTSPTNSPSKPRSPSPAGEDVISKTAIYATKRSCEVSLPFLVSDAPLKLKMNARRRHSGHRHKVKSHRNRSRSISRSRSPSPSKSKPKRTRSRKRSRSRTRSRNS